MNNKKLRVYEMINVIKRFFRKTMPLPIKNKIRYIHQNAYYSKYIKELKSSSNEKRLVLIGTPEHGNLGDHLIAEAEWELLKTFQGDYKVVEITGCHYRFQRDKIIRLIKKSDILLITGGGFLGSLWLVEENMVRDIVETFHENRIIVLPSTIYYDNNINGQQEFETSKRIYRKHNNLYFCLRDAYSIEVAKKLIGRDAENKLLFIPDIALYLDKTCNTIKREGVLFCMREDKERVLSEEDKIKIKDIVLKKGEIINYVSTVISQNIRREDRRQKLDRLINYFRGAKIVITDRLHGMILAAITGTPCIALDNISGKVRGVYAWIDYLPYIKFANSIEEIPSFIDRLLSIENNVYDNKPLLSKYERIVSLICDKE